MLPQYQTLFVKEPHTLARSYDWKLVLLQQRWQVSNLSKAVPRQRVSFLVLLEGLGHQVSNCEQDSAVLFCWVLTMKRLCQSSLGLGVVHSGATGSWRLVGPAGASPSV